jgi:hypothetical protein
MAGHAHLRKLPEAEVDLFLTEAFGRLPLASQFDGAVHDSVHQPVRDAPVRVVAATL